MTEHQLEFGKTRKLVFTSYFAMVHKLPDYIVPIAICGGIPDFWNGRPWFRKLAPKKWFFDKWKIDRDNDSYIENFKNEVLSKLDPLEVLYSLYEISNRNEKGKIPCMICYEKSGDFCHRNLVSEWMNSMIPNIVDCREYVFNRKRKNKT